MRGTGHPTMPKQQLTATKELLAFLLIDSPQQLSQTHESTFLSQPPSRSALGSLSRGSCPSGAF